jgi:hypothetical protein
MLSFVDSSSPWALPKALYGYSSYVYTRSWTSVIISFYVFKVLYVLAYYWDAGSHPSWFDGLGDFDCCDDDGGGTTTGNSTFHAGAPTLASVVVGDFLLLVGGSVLACVQSAVIDSNLFFAFTGKRNFVTVENWRRFYNNARKNVSRDAPSSSPVDDATDFPNSGDKKRGCAFVYGLWPVWIVFPCLDFDVPRVDYKSDETTETKHPERMSWYHRRYYWFYWLQILLLGTPATLAYKYGWSDDLRSGVVLYYLAQVALLIVFYFWNLHEIETQRRVYVYSKSERRTSFRWNRMLGPDKYGAVYLCWFLTVTLFCLPVVYGPSGLTSFECVGISWLFSLISWGAVVVGSVAYPVVSATAGNAFA